MLPNLPSSQRTFDAGPVPSATCPRESVLPIRLRPGFSVVFGGYAEGAVNRPCCQEAPKSSPDDHEPDLGDLVQKEAERASRAARRAPRAHRAEVAAKAERFLSRADVEGVALQGLHESLTCRRLGVR